MISWSEKETKCNQHIQVFDICGTLFNSNTTFDFLEYFFTHNRYRLFNKFRKTFLWRIVNRFFQTLFYVDVTRILAVRFLRGYPRHVLVNAAGTFYDTFLSVRQNKRVIAQLLSYQRKENTEVVLVSATLDFIAEVIASKLRCRRYYSSSLYYEKGICQGRLKNDLLGNKVKKVINDWRFQPEGVFTDNFSDVSLLELAQDKHIIVYPKTQKRWKKILKKKGWNATIIQY